LPDVWAYAKLDTYSRQNEPFLHVDGDVFISEPFSKKLLSTPLIAQGFEENMEIYQTTFSTLDKYLEYKPCWLIEGLKEPHAYNAGIIGGTDLEFFKNYVVLAQDFFTKNKNAIKRMIEKGENVGAVNLIFEQYLFYYLAKKGKKQISCFSDFVVKKAVDNEYFFRVDEEWKYIHLMGNAKRMMYMNLFISKFLKKEYPERWENIIQLFKKKGQLSDCMNHILKLHKGEQKCCIVNPEYDVSADKKVLILKEKLRLDNTNENICRYLKETYFNVESIEMPLMKHPIFDDIRNFNCEKNALVERKQNAIGWQNHFITKEIKNKYVVLNPNFKIFLTKYNWSEIYSFACNEKPFIREKNDLFLIYIDSRTNIINYTPMPMSVLLLFDYLARSPVRVSELLHMRETDREEANINNLRMLYYSGIINLLDKKESVNVRLPIKIKNLIIGYKEQMERCVNKCCEYYKLKENVIVPENFTIEKLLEIVRGCGFEAVGVRIKIEKLSEIPTPSIIIVQREKFNEYRSFVLLSVSEKHVEVYNPVEERIEKVTKEWLFCFWDGKTILLQPNKDQ